MRRMNWFRWLFRTEMMKNWLMKKIDNQPAGPKDEEREKHYTWVWGEVKNAQGETLTMRKTSAEWLYPDSSRRSVYGDACTCNWSSGRLLYAIETLRA